MNKFPIFYLQLSNEFVSFVQNESISSGEYPWNVISHKTSAIIIFLLKFFNVSGWIFKYKTLQYNEI